MAGTRRRTADPKLQYTKDRHRLLTIHDGARLTPAIVAVLSALVEAAEEIAIDLTDGQGPSSYERRRLRDELSPRLVARSDGVALYVSDRRIG